MRREAVELRLASVSLGKASLLNEAVPTNSLLITYVGPFHLGPKHFLWLGMLHVLVFAWLIRFGLPRPHQGYGSSIRRNHTFLWVSD